MQNLIEIRKNKKLTQNEVAAALGISRQAYSNYESGKRQPDNTTLSEIADFFGVTVDYLLGRDNESLASYHNIFPVVKKRFPLLGEIACGEPIYANEDRESYIESGTDIKADFCLKARGDSMIGARIMDGDIVFIKEMPIVDNGEIAAVVIGEEATLKRVYFYPEQKKLVLNAENPKYEPLVYIGDELNEVRILGKAVAFQSDVR